MYNRFATEFGGESVFKLIIIPHACKMTSNGTEEKLAFGLVTSVGKEAGELSALCCQLGTRTTWQDTNEIPRMATESSND